MKYVKLMGIVIVLGMISASQLKASISLPGGHGITSPTLVAGHAFQHLSQPLTTIPVPEPSDWAWVPVLCTVGFIAWRRLSRKSAV